MFFNNFYTLSVFTALSFSQISAASDAKSEPASKEFNTISNIILSDVVGNGAIAKVVKVRRKVDGGIIDGVVAKVVSFARVKDDPHQLKEEIELLTSLSHPNIPETHCILWNRTSVVIIMELLEGALDEHLKAYIEKSGERGFPADMVQAMAAQLFRAIEYIHQQGIMHRDIKLANILVSTDGHLKLADFGNSLKAERAKGAAGTLEYMAPEVFMGGRYDSRCDIWSFGCVVFELLHGNVPFESATIEDLVQKILNEMTFKVNEDVPKDLAKLIESCLLHTPQRPSAEKLKTKVSFLAIAIESGRVNRPISGLGALTSKSVLSRREQEYQRFRKRESSKASIADVQAVFNHVFDDVMKAFLAEKYGTHFEDLDIAEETATTNKSAEGPVNQSKTPEVNPCVNQPVNQAQHPESNPTVTQAKLPEGNSLFSYLYSWLNSMFSAFYLPRAPRPKPELPM